MIALLQLGSALLFCPSGDRFRASLCGFSNLLSCKMKFEPPCLFSRISKKCHVTVLILKYASFCFFAALASFPVVGNSPFAFEGENRFPNKNVVHIVQSRTVHRNRYERISALPGHEEYPVVTSNAGGEGFLGAHVQVLQ